ncbi:MAG: indolepyruvate ferredoxin oxidoreductase subunit alpha [Thermodesulfobacteriota bacterium]
MSHPLLSKDGGQTQLLLGNEAIVRGALEAGVAFVSCYPGTPSSEVPDTFSRLAPEGDFYFEYSANEKVALEVGGGATLAGAATLVTMKHVGVNVAADPLMTLCYVGAPGGLVLLSADDPGCHSSQNEQDNRIFARLAGMPVLEPCSAQEAKDMMRDAMELSIASEQPVMLRTTTRVSHLRGPVRFEPLPGARSVKAFEKNPRRFVPIPAVARVRHAELLKKLQQFAEAAEKSPWNRVRGKGTLGVIASGMARAYVADVLKEKEFAGKFKVLELGFTYPLPEKKLARFLKGLDKVLVVEELEPVVETEVKALIQEKGLDVKVLGKGAELPQNGEFNTANVRAALLRLLGRKPKAQPACAPAAGPLPMRPPNLCPGCSHRASYYAVRQVFGDEAVYSSDIGCYTLGILPPLAMADFLLCMGSSVSSGGGFAKAGKRPVVAFIGDSTFFHSGITGLVNAVFNAHDLVLVVLDNGTTAMTGHQPHPGVCKLACGDNPHRVDIESVVRGCGVTQVAKVAPMNLKETLKVLTHMKNGSGVRVVIAEEPCVLYAKKALKTAMPMVAYVAKQSEGVRRCVETLGCPAFAVAEGQVAINPHQCTGCMFCLQITPDIKARKRSA